MPNQDINSGNTLSSTAAIDKAIQGTKKKSYGMAQASDGSKTFKTGIFLTGAMTVLFLATETPTFPWVLLRLFLASVGISMINDGTTSYYKGKALADLGETMIHEAKSESGGCHISQRPSI